MLTIYSNGSHCSGEALDTIDQLCTVLTTNTLDPMFERYGNFITAEDDHIHFFGNFFDISHVFRLDCDDSDVVYKLETLIRANQKTPAYLNAKLQRDERDREEEKRRNSTRRYVRASRGLPCA